jgi:hypothetical protein
LKFFKPGILLHFLILLNLFFVQGCALSMAFWREESQSPATLKSETRKTALPVVKISQPVLHLIAQPTLSLQLHLQKEFEKRELLVIEKKSEASGLATTLGLLLSLTIASGGFYLDRQSQGGSSYDDFGPWGWASLAFLSADMLLSLWLGDTQTSQTTLNASPWKAVIETPGKPLYLRKVILSVAESEWQVQAQTEGNGQVNIDLSSLPKALQNRSALKLNLQLQDPEYGLLMQELTLNQENMSALRAAFSGQNGVKKASSQSINPINQVDMSLEPIPKSNLSHAGIAVIIGNQDYRQAPKTEFALHDAEMVKKYSQAVLGFKPENTLFLANASKAELDAVFGTSEEARSQLSDWHHQNTPILIYYSGHGSATAAGKSYILPIDANPNYIASSAYSLDTLYHNLARLKYSELTVIVDACFSGQTPSGPLLPDRKPLVLETKTLSPPKLSHALLMHASQANQMSVWWKEQKHSLFTYYLLKGIQGAANSNQDNLLSTTELQSYLATQVPNQARRLLGADQTPVFWGDLSRNLVDYASPN